MSCFLCLNLLHRRRQEQQVPGLHSRARDRLDVRLQHVCPVPGAEESVGLFRRRKDEVRIRDQERKQPACVDAIIVIVNAVVVVDVVVVDVVVVNALDCSDCNAYFLTVVLSFSKL